MACSAENTMESPRKLNDCYFYYYSTCIKGDNCVFRHEPSALGCETMCTAWQQGKCLDKRCKLRHMELRKNRKQIPCYWENQPGGCRKKHCPFMHKNPDARTDGIAPSQPAPPLSQQQAAAGAAPEPGAALAAAPAPAPPVPLLWPQQQRQDSAILGVLPGAGELLSRRMLPHEAPNPYAPLPVDPLVVNFEEESDNESALSSTPTKPSGEEAASSASHELALLERIQAEAAAYYRYDAPRARAARCERLSLDELAGAGAPAERRAELDFKVLSLDEIRARKKSETIIHTTPITLNLSSRKRKLSTQETITTSGNKIIKVVRSNSIVYKKVDQNAPAASSQRKADQKQSEETVNRKRTLSELSIDIYDIQDDELDDSCHEFKKIKVAEQTQKPKLIRNRSKSNKESSDNESKSYEPDSSTRTDDSDSEIQLVSIEINEKQIDVSSEIIDLDTTKLGEPIDIVDLSDDDPEVNDVTVSDLSCDLGKNVPDVVASCRRNTRESLDKDVICDIDALLDEDL